MKILYLTDQTYLHGGIEKVLSQKANHLADVVGDEVFIATYSQQGKSSIYHFSSKIIFSDFNINYEIGKSYFHKDNLIKVPQHLLKLKNYLADINPDVIISCSFGPDFYFLPFINKQIPKIKEYHSSRYFYSEKSKSKLSNITRKLGNKIENKYDQIIVLNNEEKFFYNSSHISVIPNPAEKTDSKANLVNKRIIAAGRISPVKKFDFLIDIFASVAKDFPDWELHFWGEDYLGTVEKLQNKISQLDLNKQIKFKGICPDLKKEMQNYSIYAMTSETECFPMVLLESLSVGLPVISHDCPTGPKHILTTEEDSFLVPYQNLDIFADKLKLLMNSEVLREQLGNNGIKNVERFDISTVIKQWKNLFSHLIAKQKY